MIEMRTLPGISKSVGFYSVKVIAIIFITIVYVIVGAAASLSLESLLPRGDPSEISTPILLLQLTVAFTAISIAYYSIRIQIKHLPRFLDGWYGFDHTRLREAAGGIIVAFVMYCYQDRLRDMMKEIGSRAVTSAKSVRDRLLNTIKQTMKMQ